MSQNDLSIANQGFASFRSDLNSALQALGSTNSGTSAPSTTYANQLFYDTTNKILKIRNEDNDAFISLFTLDQANDNIESLTIDGTLNVNGGVVFNENSANVDFRVESDANTHALFLEGSSGNVGIGVTSPDADLTIPSPSFGSGGTGNGIRFQNTNNDADAIIQSYYSGTTASALLHGQNLYLATNASFTNFDSSKASSYILQNTDGQILFANASSSAPSERMRVDSSGLLRIGNTTGTLFDSSSATGIVAGTSLQVSNSGGTVGFFNRLSSDGSILVLYKDGTAVGNIGSVFTSSASRIFLANSDTGLHFNGSTEQIIPCNGTGAKRDNGIALGNAFGRFTQLFANSSSINTSDQNEKQDITSLTAKELSVAKKLSTLFKTYRWKDRVEEKGDEARTHTGIIAQDIQSEFSAEGLDAYKYGLFCSDTLWEKDEKVYYTKEEAPKDAEEKTRLGVRYAELFSFIFSSIEARLTALESK